MLFDEFLSMRIIVSLTVVALKLDDSHFKSLCFQERKVGHGYIILYQSSGDPAEILL
jgi:hypothetical protein